jgi:peroxiredoxin Q/BCP
MPHKLPAVGDRAPDFSLPASDGSTVHLAVLLGRKPIVLYFYPKADTPGCTTQACGFRDAMSQFKKASIPVFGISPDPIEKVRKFAGKFKLNFPLLADADHAVAERYGVWQEKSMYGRKYMGIARTTFLIAPDGRIRTVLEKVKPAGHEQEVWNLLQVDHF